MSDLARTLDPGNNKANLLFNKYLGYAYSGVALGNEFQTSATPKIPKNLIMADDIPQFAPPLNPVQTVDFWYKPSQLLTDRLSNTNVPVLKSYKKYTPVDSNTKIEKYEEVLLYGFLGDADRVFYFRKLQNDVGANPPVKDNIFDSENILQNAIAKNYDSITNSYSILVEYYNTTTSLWGEVPENKYVFDRDAGIISFYEFGLVSQNNPPRVSFWRYVGNFGTISNVTTAVFSINSNGDAYLKDKRVAIGKDTVNTGYTFDISGNLNVDGNITQNGVPITGVLDDNNKYDFKQLPMAPKIDNLGIYAVNDGSGNKRDDYTSAIHKIDNWVYKYMLSQPDAIDTSGGEAGVVSAGPELIFYWNNNPQQYKFGFSDKKLPAINKIHAEVDISGNGATPDYYPFGVDGSGLYVPGMNEINALVLSKMGTYPAGTGRKEQRTITVGGIQKTIDAFVYYNTNLGSAADDILITIWYSNNAEQIPNRMMQFNLGQFLSLYPPTAVTANTPTVGQNTINTSWTAPLYGSTTDGTAATGLVATAPNPTISSYKVSYDATSSKKYGGTPSVQPITPTVVLGTSATTTAAPGGTTYTATIEAQNTSNPLYNNDISLTNQYGVDVTGIVVPDPPTTGLNMISESGVNFSTYDFTGILPSDLIYSVGGTTNIPKNMITFQGDATKNSLPITNIAVLNETNIGTGTKAEILDTENHKTTLNAYPTLNAVDDANGGAISTAAIVDPYFNTINDRLYLKASYNYKLYTSGKADANAHVISYTQNLYDIVGTITATKTTLPITYYVDNLPKTTFATVSAATIETPTLTDDGTTIVKKLCGITALSPTTNKNTIILNTYDINTSDIGRYYYNGTKVVKVAPMTQKVVGIVSCTLQAANPRDTTDSAITLNGTELPSVIKLYTSSSPLALPLTLNTDIIYGTQIQLAYMPNNLNKENGAGSLTKTVNVIIDPSLRNNELTTPANIFNTLQQTVRNHIITVPSGTGVGTYEAFSNSESLVGNYSNELLYANGAYRYKESSPTYLIDYSTYAGNNTVDYTNIKDNSNRRYALFTFNVPQATNATIKNLRIQFEGLNQTLVKTATDNIKLSSESNDDPSQLLAVLYRFESNPENSIWIDAFSTAASTTLVDIKNPVKNMSVGGYKGTSIVTTADTQTLEVFPFEFNPSTTLSSDLKVHVLVGISPLATGITFKNIKCSYST